MKIIFSSLIFFLATFALQAAETDIKVINYNVGSSYKDYMNVVRYLNSQIVPTENDYLGIEQRSAQTILNTKPDVLFFQELGKEPTKEQKELLNAKTRPFLIELQNANYQLISDESRQRAACAVAINKDRFELVHNHSFSIKFSEEFIQDVAIAHVRDLITQKDVVLISAHVPGFNVMNPESDRVQQGDVYLETIIDQLKQKNLDTYHTIIGADMNANRKILKNHSERFTNLRNEGFDDFWTNKDTNVNMDDGQGTHKLRNIDCILYRTPNKREFFSSALRFVGLGKSLNLFPGFEEWNSELISSDHRPVYTNISYK